MKKVLFTKYAPDAIGPYSQGVEGSGIIITSGQLPIEPETGEIVQGDMAAQTRQSLENVKAVLVAAGADMNDVIKTTVFLKDINNFAIMNSVYTEFFPEGQYPARSAVEVARLPKDVLVEIEAIAVR